MSDQINKQPAQVEKTTKGAIGQRHVHARYQLDEGITPVPVPGKEFERGISLLVFANRFVNNNSQDGREVTRSDIEIFWTVEVMTYYKKNCPERARLLGQIRSPRFQNWCENKDFEDVDWDEVERELDTGLQPHFRPPTAAEMQQDPDVVIIGDETCAYLIPGIWSRPLADLNFLDMAQEIRSVNWKVRPNYRTMQNLWRDIVLKLYYFEHPRRTNQKIGEGAAVNLVEYRRRFDDVVDSSDEESQPTPPKKRIRKERSDAENSEGEDSAVAVPGPKSSKPKKKRRQPPKKPFGEATPEEIAALQHDSDQVEPWLKGLSTIPELPEVQRASEEASDPAIEDVSRAETASRGTPDQEDLIDRGPNQRENLASFFASQRRPRQMQAAKSEDEACENSDAEDTGERA